MAPTGSTGSERWLPHTTERWETTVGITEKQRHDLFTKFEEMLGSEHAATMMELLPPVGWADVATKRDLDASSAATKRDLDASVALVRQDLESSVAAVRHEIAAVEERLTLRMATKDDLDRLRRDVATWLFTAVGVQTAVIGVLLALT